jgi:hypothetical protein
MRGLQVNFNYSRTIKLVSDLLGLSIVAGQEAIAKVPWARKAEVAAFLAVSYLQERPSQSSKSTKTREDKSSYTPSKLSFVAAK